jgi:hypothetical protein
MFFTATGVAAAMPSAEAAGGPSASATLTNSGCDLTATYTWNGFHEPKKFVQVRIFDETLGMGRLVSVDFNVPESSGTFEPAAIGGVNGHTYIADGQLKKKTNNDIIPKSIAKSAPLVLSC